MSPIRCTQCHAAIPVPAELAARTMQCAYCGTVAAVPDLAAREQAIAALRRGELAQRQAEADATERREEAARARRRERAERKARRRSARGGWLWSLFMTLLVPAVVCSITFDLPARLGYGEDGHARLAMIASQLRKRGCEVLAEPTSSYASATISRLVQVEHGCLRVIATGGPAHATLTLRVFDRDNKQVARSKPTDDPEVDYCPPGAGSLRYDIVLNRNAKGRLSHMALSCPAPAPARPSRPRKPAGR